MPSVTKLVSLVSRHTLWAEGQVFAISPERISFLEGARAAVAIGVMLGAAVVFHIPDFAFGAVAAFWNCLCDPLGSNDRRLRTMGFFSLLGAAVMMLASYGAHWGPVASSVSLFALVLFCGMTRSYSAAFGPSPAQAGLLASLAVIIGITSPRELSGAVTLGSFFLTGSVWTILLTIYAWPIRERGTSERTLASLFARLEDMAEALQRLDEKDEPAGWQIFDTTYRRGIRLSIERGRETAARISSDGAHLGAGIDAAGRVFEALIALGSHRRSLSQPFDPLLEKPLLTELQRLLQGIAQSGPHAETIMSQARAVLQQAKGYKGLVARAAVFATAAVLRLADDPQEPGREAQPQKGAVRPLTLQVDTIVWRHALRVATAVLLAYAVGNWFFVTFSYWAAIAALVVTLPMSANTWLRVLERAVGSLIGGLIAAVLITQISSPVAMVLVIVPLSALVIALRLVSYGAFVIFLTPMFMLLADFIRPAEGLIAARFVNELIGACLGVAASFLLWPEKERDALATAIATAVSENIAFASCVLRGRDDGTGDLEKLQRDAGLASSRLETARERMLLEGHFGLRRDDHLREIISALRTVCGATAVLEITGIKVADEGDRQRADRYDALAATLRDILSMPAGDPVRSFTEEVDDLDRAVQHLALAVYVYRKRSLPAA